LFEEESFLKMMRYSLEECRKDLIVVTITIIIIRHHERFHQRGTTEGRKQGEGEKR